MNNPRVNIDILVIKDEMILLGLLSKNWLYNGTQVYGVPGRDIQFKETMGEAINRNIREETGCTVKKYEIIAVNANYALENHYIGIGAIAEIEGEAKILKPEDWEKWEWFKKDETPTNLFPAAKHLIQCYLGEKVTVSE